MNQPALNGATSPHPLCAAICRVVVLTHQNQPELLGEKYRSSQWLSLQHQTALIEKLQAGLVKIDPGDRQALSKWVDQLLKILFVPAFFESAQYQQLMVEIGLVDPSHNGSHKNQATVTEAVIDSVNGKQNKSTDAIAILLLDAENLQPSVEVEKFLSGICSHPLRIKIAFANWRSLGKHDSEFYNRGYDLIHVPGGRDMADGKMIAVGSSIHEHYPNVKEVLVCSSDKVMASLCTRLHQCGLSVYSVQKKDEAIVVTNSNTHETINYCLKPKPDIPPFEVCIAKLQELVKAQQKQTGNTWIKLAVISKLFQSKTGFTITEMMAVHAPGKKAKDLFLEHSAKFAAHQPSEKEGLYITVFDTEVSSNSTVQSPVEGRQGHAKKDSQEGTKYAELKIKSSTDLEKILVDILDDLVAKSKENYTAISIVGTQFYTKYGQPIKTVISNLDLNLTFIKFLQSCKSFDLQQSEKGWHMARRKGTSRA